MAVALLLTALVLPTIAADAVPDETFADDFSPAGFGGSDGSLGWATDWIEKAPTEYIAFWRQAVASVLGPPHREPPVVPAALLGPAPVVTPRSLA
mgnify:CR=1 FL=1